MRVVLLPGLLRSVCFLQRKPRGRTLEASYDVAGPPAAVAGGHCGHVGLDGVIEVPPRVRIYGVLVVVDHWDWHAAAAKLPRDRVDFGRADSRVARQCTAVFSQLPLFLEIARAKDDELVRINVLAKSVGDRGRREARESPFPDRR